VEVTLDVDANGILNVTARDKDTDAQQGITISETSNLDQAEVNRMIEEAERNRSADQTLRQEIDARNELDNLAYQVQRRLDELGDTAPTHERARAEMLVADARQAVSDRAPVERVRELTSELQGVLGGLRSAGTSNEGTSAADQPGAADAGAADDDVIDAEFDRS
jgi:molecular chaperone DnaK